MLSPCAVRCKVTQPGDEQPMPIFTKMARVAETGQRSPTAASCGPVVTNGVSTPVRSVDTPAWIA
jgi:hypothetical protein